MTYRETLDWMFAQLPMYQEKGKVAFKGKLDHILDFCAHLSHPENEFKSIHVAGTNGKGSSSHMLASILQEAGYNVGLYTSPHLKDFRERIRINGVAVEEGFVVNFIKKNKPFLAQHSLSFFEMTVGMAFSYFAQQKVDIAIVEVGLGGRLDSTNIIRPEVALITNIGYDHMDILGDSLEAIAYEKGGIIKKGVPTVISEYQAETAPVFRAIAKEQHSPLVFADKIELNPYKTELLGDYQAKNVKGVVATIHALERFVVPESAIVDGLMQVVKNTALLGRWQVLQENPRVVCDSAHNREGLEIVLQQIQDQTFKQLHIVLGVVKDKNLGAILPLFPKTAHYYFCSPNVHRGLEVEHLAAKGHQQGLIGETYASVQAALDSALEHSSSKDFIFIGGSTFTVAEVV